MSGKMPERGLMSASGKGQLSPGGQTSNQKIGAKNDLDIASGDQV
jgi:hypothetical protein